MLTVQNIKEAVNWLGYTYVSMLRSPELYGIAVREGERSIVGTKEEGFDSCCGNTSFE